MWNITHKLMKTRRYGAFTEKIEARKYSYLKRIQIEIFKRLLIFVSFHLRYIILSKNYAHLNNFLKFF